MGAGGRPSDALEGLFIAACLRIAAANEGGYVPSPDEAAVLFGSNGAPSASANLALSRAACSMAAIAVSCASWWSSVMLMPVPARAPA